MMQLLNDRTGSRRKRIAGLVFVMLAVLFVWPTLSRAQVGPGLLLPFKAEERTELFFEAYSQFAGTVGDSIGGPGTSGSDFRVSRFDASGRADLTGVFFEPATDGERVQRFHAGFESIGIDLDTPVAILPERLVSHKVGVSLDLFRYKDYDISIAAGVGYAGTAPFSDGDAYFGLATIAATRVIDRSRVLTLFIDYDGNRNIFPDFPLIGAIFRHRLNERFTYIVGVPFARAIWTPGGAEGAWTIEGVATIGSIEGKVTYELTDAVSFFGEFARRNDGFVIDQAEPAGVSRRRIYFEQSRLEAGVVIDPSELTGLGAVGEIVIAGGYAFEQEFREGFDTRNDVFIAAVSDEPYLRISARLGF